MSRVYVGTAGWSYEDWAGVVYPEPKERGFHPLGFLARFLDIVEINSTFYRTPPPAMAVSWVGRVRSFPDFLFAVKVHQVFTHDRETWTRKDADDFRLAIEPLRAAGRLASLLFQFPWSFIGSPAHLDYLERLFRLFEGHPMTVELRHATWDTPRTYELLRERRVCFCNIDQPVFPDSIKPTAVATLPDYSYVRLHGRNYKDWFRKDAGRDDRYNYLYSKNELEEWVERIKQLGRQSGRIYVITNNHYRGQAMANALQIKNMITREKVDIPASLLKTYPVLEEIVRKIAKGQLDLFERKE